MSTKNILNKSYKDFELLSINEIPDCNSVGIYLRHKKTGLDVFHLVNDDEENLFAFCFRTPVKNSTGAAHILEHSVFCGSQKFPLKEPFTNMMNQSVNTFLNALTYPDKTVYPASSLVQKDYFNLMDVYGDAVFFPLLRKEAFYQEAYRLEINEKEEFELQGVVYNEMKGSYSSFDSVATDEQVKSIFANTVYAEDSGGDPLHIPTFTYEDFKEFHKTYYKPNNCLLFLFGNIPTEVQLDFVQEHFLDRIQDYPSEVNFSATPNVNSDFLKWETPEELKEPKKVSAVAPNVGATGSTVTLNWLCGNSNDLYSYLECAFLCEVLLGHDGSPLAKALTDSELGDDLAPYSGITGEMKSFFASFGLHGVQKKNVNKVYELIFSVLEKLSKIGVSKKDIDAALMSVEFLNREVVRGSGPYSLALLDRVLRQWNYGSEPHKGLLYRKNFEIIRENAKNDSEYIQKLIKKFFLNNTNCSYIDVAPSDSYLKERAKKEQELIKELSQKIDIVSYKNELNILHEYQNHRETPEETACIPSLFPSDIDSELKEINAEMFSVENNGSKVPIIKSIVDTNGISYIEVLFPADVLDAEDYLYLPFFADCSTNCGWNGKSWSVCAEEVAIKTGGIFAQLHAASKSQTKNTKKMEETIIDKNIIARDWLSFRCKFLSEKTQEGLDLLSEVINTYEFNDVKRVKKLLKEIRTGIRSSLVPRGNRYAALRSRATFSHEGLLQEIWFGIRQFFFIEKLAYTCPKKIVKKLNSIKEKIAKAGGVIHVISDKESYSKVEDCLPKFINTIGLKNPSPKTSRSDDEFAKMLLVKNEKFLPEMEIFTTSSQVGYSSSVMNASGLGTKETVAEIVLAHWLSGTFLWDKIRTTGGAYGASATVSSIAKCFTFSTYRDPNPLKSVNVFIESLQEAAQVNLSNEECDKLITGTYGEEFLPVSPATEGRIGLIRILASVSNEDQKDKLKNLLSVKPEDLKDAAERIFQNSSNTKTTIIGDKALKKYAQNKAKKTSVIVKLPL